MYTSTAMKQLSIIAVLLLCSALYAQDRVAAAIDSLPSVKSIDQVAISPDGLQVAYIVAGELFVAPVPDGPSHRVAPNQNATREVTWSVDSHQLAWLTDLPGEKPASQLWSASADGSEMTQRVTFQGYAQSPRYSPDGKTISVLYIEGMPRVAGPLEPMTPLAGVVGSKIYEQRLTTIDLITNRQTQVSPDDVYVYEYDWLPDSSGWIGTAAQGSGDNNWWIAGLYWIDSASGNMREIYKPKWQIAEPHVSPDGKRVALIEGLMSDEGLTGGDVMLVSISGGPARNLTPGIHASPSSLSWRSNDRICIVANVDGNSAVTTLTTAGLQPGARWNDWTGEEVIGRTTEVWVPSASFSRDGSVSAVVRQSPKSPPEVWAGPAGEWRQITHLNDGVSAQIKTRNVHWMSDGHQVQGWLTFPKDYDSGKKYPLVITVHGGPSWACLANWGATAMGDMRAAARLGWFVLCPNPRGSYGQGEAFTQGNVKDFGGGDFRDLMAGVDAVIKQFPIDSGKLAIRGHSYGGYMTMWAGTQTTRFAAAVAGAGLSDWRSYYGLNDIDEWMIPFFGASVYDDPAVYEKSDPLHFVKKVRTPTLILVGDSDGEVPMEQSVEWYHALETRRVPVQLVVYPGEGHLFKKPADTRDYTLRTLQWFDHWFSAREKQ
ncbi:MAG TPA: S9 family peptidase [Terriglobales bacterium]|nr:S9 family peptidase [Terriglobales bacterium]